MGRKKFKIKKYKQIFPSYVKNYREQGRARGK